MIHYNDYYYDYYLKSIARIGLFINNLKSIRDIFNSEWQVYLHTSMIDNEYILYITALEHIYIIYIYIYN